MKFYRAYTRFFASVMEGIKNLIFKITHAKNLLNNPTFITFELALIIVIIYVMNRDNLTDKTNEAVSSITSIQLLPIWIALLITSTIFLYFIKKDGNNE